MNIPKNCPLTITGVKTVRGTEGLGYNSTLRYEGIIVATVDDPADGGPLHIQWIRDKYKPAVTGLAQEARVWLEEYVESLPTEKCTVGGTTFDYRPDADTFLDALVDYAGNKKKLVSIMKNHICAIEGGKTYTYRTAATSENIAKFKKSHPQRLVLNEMNHDEATRLFMEGE